MVEKFNYVDANHDGSISIDELKEVYKMFDPEYDEAKVAADFEKFDADHNGKVSMAEFLRAEGIDVSKFDAAELGGRGGELEAEQEALRRGVAAVEIVPGGMESQEVGVEASCVSAVGVGGAARPSTPSRPSRSMSQFKKRSADGASKEAAKEEEAASKTLRLKIKNVSFAASDDDVRRWLGGIDVRSLDVPRRPNGKGRGHAVVAVASPEAEAKLLSRDGAALLGRAVEVRRLAEPLDGRRAAPASSASNSAAARCGPFGAADPSLADASKEAINALDAFDATSVRAADARRRAAEVVHATTADGVDRGVASLRAKLAAGDGAVATADGGSFDDRGHRTRRAHRRPCLFKIEQKVKGAAPIGDWARCWSSPAPPDLKMSDPTAEDFLVNQQIKDFAFDLHDATRRSHLAEDIKRLYTVEFKELSEKYCDKQPWPVAEAIASQCIGNDGAPDAYFLCVYRELMFRHMFAKLKTAPRIGSRRGPTTALFDFVLAGDDAATELSSQWVFDILHEFVYQFQSFCQYRTQNSGGAPRRSLLEASDACWHAPTVLGYLLRLAELGRAADGPAGRVAPSPLHYQMGYLAISGAAECLLGDYEASVAALGAVDPFDEGAEFAKIFSCRLNVLYHLGYSLMMLKRYRDALATFDGVLAHLARLAKHGGLQRFPAADQVQKMNDRMLALFAIALALAPGFPVGGGVAAIKDKSATRWRSWSGDAATFDNMLTYASPKFVVPSIPDYGAPVNSSHDAYKQQIRLFNDEVLQQQKLSKIRSYLKLHVHRPRQARASTTSPSPRSAQLVGIKAKLRLDDRKPIGAARLDAAGGADDIHFYVKGDMIHVDEPATQAARHDDFFANQMKKYDDYIEVVKGLDAKPPPPPASPRAAQDRD
ncbi:hypothetical protein JL722_14212 [Aureococcus anophagefferens]|nr:hypothetical protein JL722_14212 [Aureococcus anophagefferens]